MIFINHTDELKGKVVSVEINGALDSDSSPDFEEYINQLLEKSKIFVILDAKNLKYVSSAGFGLFIYIQKKLLSAKGFLILCNVNKEIIGIYNILGFDKILKIVKDKDEALTTMQKHISLLESEKPAESRRATSVEVQVESQSLGQDISSSVSERSFDHPIILECAGCKGMIRVKKSGVYICPDCKSRFTVEPDQTVVF